MLIDTTWRRVTLRALSNSLRMTRRADPSSREEQEVALLRWAEQRGAWISDKIELRQTDYGGRSFFALSRIEEGEVRERESNSPRASETVHSRCAPKRRAMGARDLPNCVTPTQDVMRLPTSKDFVLTEASVRAHERIGDAIRY